MAGAGYDISASLADSKTLGQQTYGGTFIAFSGSSLSGGSNTQSAKLTADATATNRSPGTVNSLSDGGQELQTPNGRNGSNTGVYLAIGALALLILLKE